MGSRWDVDVEDHVSRRSSRTTREPRISVISESAVGNGVSPLGRRMYAGVVGAGARSAPLPDDLLRTSDLKDPAVPDVGHDHVAVRQRIGVIRRVEPTVGATREVVLAVLPDDPSVAMSIRTMTSWPSSLATIVLPSGERNASSAEKPWPRGRLLRAGNRHWIVPAGSTIRIRPFWRSAINR